MISAGSSAVSICVWLLLLLLLLLYLLFLLSSSSSLLLLVMVLSGGVSGHVDGEGSEGSFFFFDLFVAH